MLIILPFDIIPDSLFPCLYVSTSRLPVVFLDNTLLMLMIAVTVLQLGENTAGKSQPKYNYNITFKIHVYSSFLDG